MSSGKYFRALVRAIPKKYEIKNPSADQPVFTQHSKDELRQYKLANLPVHFEHIAPVSVTDKEEGKPVNITYDRSMAIGRVVDNFVTDDNELMCIIEIDPEANPGSTNIMDRKRRLQKDAVIKLIENNHLKDVSFSHYNDHDYQKDSGMTLIQKLPVELSVVKQGAREGSNIIQYHYSDKPYLDENEYKDVGFDHYSSAAKSHIRFIDDDMSNTSNTSSAVDPSLLAELEKLRKENAALNNTVKEMSPLAEQMKKKKAEEEQARAAAFQQNMTNLYDKAIEMAKNVKDGNINVGEMDSDTKAAFEHILTKLPADKGNISAQVGKLFSPDKGTVSSEQALLDVERALGAASNAITVCSVILAKHNVVVEEMQKKKAMESAKSAAGHTGAAGKGVASEPQKRAVEETQPGFTTWEEMLNEARKTKQARISADE